MKKFLEDFKNFAVKGNIFDLAIGVIIGGAFGKIVTSLVNDIITPVLSIIVGRTNLSDVGYTIKNTDITIKYGAFTQNIIDFLIISLSIFIVMRIFSRFKKKQEAEEIKEEEKPEEIQLLTEIRDLLKSRDN